MHNIIYRSYPEKSTHESIIRECLKIVRSNGDRYGTTGIRFLEGSICDNRESAIDYIAARDRGDYDGLAVRYYEFGKVPETKRVTDLRAKFAEVEKARREFQAAHLPAVAKAEYVGCRNCGSKVNREYLRHCLCPVCHTDLRSSSVLERLRKYENQLNDLQEKINAELLKSREKASVLWLVKFEYHS